MVFCCIAIVGVAVIYFFALWIRQLFTWPRKDLSVSDLRPPPRALSGHGALPVYGHTNLFQRLAGDTALLFPPHWREIHFLPRWLSCCSSSSSSSIQQQNLGDCFAIYIWGQWRVAVKGPVRAKQVFESQTLKEAFPWTPPETLLGKSCLPFLSEEEADHFRALIERPLSQKSVIQYAPLFAEAAENCLDDIVSAASEAKGLFHNNNNSHHHLHNNNSRHQNTSKRKKKFQRKQQSSSGDGDSLTFDYGPHDLRADGNENDNLLPLHWEALRSYSFDLVDGPIFGLNKWNNRRIPQQSQGQSTQEGGAETSQNKNNQSISSQEQKQQQKDDRLPKRDTMLLWMERMKLGVDVIKCTFGPEWMYIWLLNEYGRALNARMKLQRFLSKHVKSVSHTIPVKHHRGRSYRDPTTQPIPLLTMHKNYMREKEGIYGKNYVRPPPPASQLFPVTAPLPLQQHLEEPLLELRQQHRHQQQRQRCHTAPAIVVTGGTIIASDSEDEHEMSRDDSNCYYSKNNDQRDHSSMTTATATKEPSFNGTRTTTVTPPPSSPSAKQRYVAPFATEQGLECPLYYADKNKNNNTNVSPEVKMDKLQDIAGADGLYTLPSAGDTNDIISSPTHGAASAAMDHCLQITAAVSPSAGVKENMEIIIVPTDLQQRCSATTTTTIDTTECSSRHPSPDVDSQQQKSSPLPRARSLEILPSPKEPQPHQTEGHISSMMTQPKLTYRRARSVSPEPSRRPTPMSSYNTNIRSSCSTAILRENAPLRFPSMGSETSISSRQGDDDENIYGGDSSYNSYTGNPVKIAALLQPLSLSSFDIDATGTPTPTLPLNPLLLNSNYANRRRKKPKAPVSSLLDRLMRQEDANRNGISQAIMCELSILLWLMLDVGNAWTAMALNLLTSDCDALAMVQEELDSLERKYGRSNLFSKRVLNRMKCIDALLYEAIRLSPPFMGGLKTTTKTIEFQDIGVQLPKNSFIFFCQPTEDSFNISKALGKKPEELGMLYPTVELYGFLPLQGLEIPLMVLQSKVFLITLLQRYSPHISKRTTFIHRVSTAVKERFSHSVSRLKVSLHSDEATTTATESRHRQEQQHPGQIPKGDEESDAVTSPPISSSALSQMVDCDRSHDIEKGVLATPSPLVDTDTEPRVSTPSPPTSFTQHQLSSSQSSSHGMTPTEAMRLFTKIPFPEPRRVIYLRPRELGGPHL